MKHLGTLERGEEMGELVKDMDYVLVHLCVHNTKGPNSTHPITVTSPMQTIMPVMNRCLHTCSESSWHVQQKAHTLPPPPHTQPLVSMFTTSTQQWTHSLPAALQSRNAASEPY